MKIKEGFILKKVAGNNVVIGVGKTMQTFNGMINLSESAAFLFERLGEDTTAEALCDALCAEYEVDRDTASADINAFIEKLRSVNILEE